MDKNIETELNISLKNKNINGFNEILEKEDLIKNNQCKIEIINLLIKNIKHYKSIDEDDFCLNYEEFIIELLKKYSNIFTDYDNSNSLKERDIFENEILRLPKISNNLLDEILKIFNINNIIDNDIRINSLYFNRDLGNQPLKIFEFIEYISKEYFDKNSIIDKFTFIILSLKNFRIDKKTLNFYNNIGLDIERKYYKNMLFFDLIMLKVDQDIIEFMLKNFKYDINNIINELKLYEKNVNNDISLALNSKEYCKIKEYLNKINQ